MGKDKCFLRADMEEGNSKAASSICCPTRAAVPRAVWRPEGTSLKRVIGGASGDPLENTNGASSASRATRNRLGQALHIPVAAELSQLVLLPMLIPLQDKGLSRPTKDTSQQ